jgi:hypothetical protein
LIHGFLGLGRLADGAFTEYSGYVRPAFFLSLGQPSIGQVPQIEGPTAPVHAVVSHGCIYENHDSTRALVVWPWSARIVVPAPIDGCRVPQFPAMDIAVSWSTPTQHALNASLRPGADLTIERGVELGKLDGRPLIALLHLAVVGGTIVARASMPRTTHPRAA